MKKLMILMLAIAMLFSFTACDNSTKAQDDQQIEEDNKPDDQQPGGENTPPSGSNTPSGQPQTQVETFSDDEIANIAKTIADLFTNKTYGLVANFDGNLSDIIDDDHYTYNETYEKIIYKPDKLISFTDSTITSTDLTITIEGKEASVEDFMDYIGVEDSEELRDLFEAYSTLAHGVILDKYTVDFSTPWDSSESADSMLSGSVSREIGGMLLFLDNYIDMDSEAMVQLFDLETDIKYVIMPNMTSVEVVGEGSVPGSKLVEAFDDDQYASADLTTDKYTTASAYEKYLAEQVASENQ